MGLTGLSRSILALLTFALLSLPATASAEIAKAVFAGGCFWCMEEAFDKVPGVVATTSGYAGGSVANPSYRQVVAGGTGHYEVVEVQYDTAKVSYDQLLDTYWKNVDPFDGGGQFCDRGQSYASAIFAPSEEASQAATVSKAAVEAKFGKPVATKILRAAPFYPAEDYHQNYYKTNALKYRSYKYGCGRPARLSQLWG
jgi:peptide-methionine (S)-S-oxide reductase